MNTVGCCTWIDNKAPMDAYAVSIIKKEGGIPYVRSPVPQGLFSLHTNNFIWGESKNPHDKSRSCAGSSGGEAGLVAARCSPLGLGSDFAGSIRAPAVFCGVTGFKPTPFR